MNIEVNLFASLARYKPEKTGPNSWVVNCMEGITINALLQQLKVPMKEVKLIFINGIHATGESILKDKDRVGVFPPIGGG
jgi:sulfur carrier protein ThiS